MSSGKRHFGATFPLPGFLQVTFPVLPLCTNPVLFSPRPQTVGEKPHLGRRQTCRLGERDEILILLHTFTETCVFKTGRVPTEGRDFEFSTPYLILSLGKFEKYLIPPS